MNNVTLVGRLVRNPEMKTLSNDNAMTTFTLAVDREFSREKEADFLRIVVYGKPAENCNRYLAKGSQAAVKGRIQTGSYTKQDGTKVYTTDIVADRVEFLSSPPKPKDEYDGFHEYQDDDEDDIPF